MSARAFHISLGLLAALVLLSCTSFAGAMIGVLCGFTVAFFLAPAVFAVSAALSGLGIEASGQTVIALCAALYGAAVLCGFVVAGRRWHRGEPGAARTACAKACLFASLPLVAYLSMNAMARSWPA